MPLPAILPLLLAGLAGVALTLIVIALLKFPIIKEWFLNFFAGRQRIKNKDEVAFTLKEKLSTGNVKVVQGIFDKTSNEVVDGVEYNAKRLDNTLSNYHKNNDVVVYE